MPGQVLSYDAGKQRANIQVTVKSGRINENGDRVADEIAVHQSVPCIHLGGGGFRMVSPIAPGDTVLIVYCSRHIGPWLDSGGVTDPGSDQHHSISDAVAICGLRDFAHPLGNAPSDHASIGYDNGATIEMRQNEIRIGGDIGTDSTILVSSFMTAMDKLIASISSAFGSLPGGIGAGAASAVTGAGITFDTAAASFTSLIAKVK